MATSVPPTWQNPRDPVGPKAELAGLLDEIDVLVDHVVTGSGSPAAPTLAARRLEDALQRLDHLLAALVPVTARSAPVARGVPETPAAAASAPGPSTRPFVTIAGAEIRMESVIRLVALLTMAVVIMWALANWIG